MSIGVLATDPDLGDRALRSVAYDDVDTAIAEIYAGTDAMGYLLIFFCFPVIGLIVSAAAAACANPPPRKAGSGLRDGR